MKNVLKCLFGLLDLIKWFKKKGVYIYGDHINVFNPMPISEGVTKISENLPDNYRNRAVISEPYNKYL
jgi:hypothetical protein